MKSSVTVIMPYYKKRRFVLSSFKSFANQEFKDKNLIIIYEAKFSFTGDVTIDFGQVILLRIRLRVSGTTPR